MASLNLSANGPSISKSYQSVVDSPLSAAAESASTFAKWALFSVSTPLVNAFQQDAGNKESVLKVQDTGEGELADLLDEFSEGKVQFAFVKVVDANTGLPKSVLIAWCGEGVPERTKGYFTSHLATVSKFLHGYHVQITARSDADLTVEGIIQKVGDASGSKYTPASDKPTSSGPRPPVSSKPVFTPLRTGNVSAGAMTTAPLPVRTKSNDDDGWGPDAPPVTRTNLEKVKPAYQPTRVNMQEIRSGKQVEPLVHSSNTTAHQDDDVVKGGYQPIGKVDIAAIRKQAREAGDVKDDRPEPVKGAYEPVGKVDIAAIRARAQKADEPIASVKQNTAPSDGLSGTTVDHDFDQSNRLTSLPKPKVSNKFGGNPTFTGTKPPLPGATAPSAIPLPPVGSASRTFADQGGKTPAQLWAEKKAKERGQEPTAVIAPSTTATPPVQSQHSGGTEWKSSYSGRNWAPVQTSHTGRSNEGGRNDTTDPTATATVIPQPETTQQSVETIPDQPTQESSDEPHSSVETTGFGASTGTPTDTSLGVSHELGPSQPDRVRTPEAEASEGESSPIRVAVPVARGTADDKEEEPPTSTTVQVDGGFPADKDRFDDAQGASSISAEAVPEATPAFDAGVHKIRALVQYDYDKAEDNEIDLKEDEYVTDIEMVDQDWWLGLNARGEKGLFPSNYVEVIEDGTQSRAETDNQPANDNATDIVAAHSSTSESRGKPTAKALYDYEAAEDNELSFPEGAEIINIDFPDDDWWLGEFHGKTGLFPANYVQIDE